MPFSLFALAGLTLVLATSGCQKGPGDAVSTIDYRGEKIRLSKPYATFEAYKDDPDNIDPSENARVERLMLEAQAASSHPDAKALYKDAFTLKFPGYGLGSLADTPGDKAAAWLGYSIEIPRTSKTRYVLYHRVGNEYVLADDFVSSSEGLASRVREADGQLIFVDPSGRTLFQRPLKKG